MEQGTTFIAILHIAAALLLITVVLLQDGKGGGMGGAFGGGGSQTLFGATGATTFLVKVTRILAVIFMLTCMGLALVATRTINKSVLDGIPLKPATPVSNGAANGATPGTPAAPGTAAPAGEAAPATSAPAQQNTAPQPVK